MSQTQTPTLRLTPPAEPADTYFLERRTSDRHVIAGRVTAVRSEPGPDGHRNKISSLVLLNMSDGGVGALSQDHIAPDSRIAIFFPPHGADRGFDLFGKVVRCTPRETGHEIGICLEQRAAA